MQFDSYADAAPEDALSTGTSPWATTATTVITYPYTGDYRIDVLLDSDPGNLNVTSRWNYNQPLGTAPATAITFSFMTSVPSYGGNTDVPGATGFQQFTAAQKQATRDILTKLGNELNIHFVEVADTGSSFGQIRLGQNNQAAAGTAGYTYLPNSAGDGVAGLGLSGDLWLDYTYSPNHNLTPGTEGYATLLHELGHAIGLKHPGNYNAGNSASDGAGNFLDTAEDNFNYTVMSYNYEPQGDQEREWYGMYDLLALKALYGANPNYYAGDTTYSYTDADGRKLEIIDDASGSDTINLSQLTLGATVDLRAGGFSSIGRDALGFAAVDNVSIDLTTSVEKVVGTNFADHFLLPLGTESVNGGGGIDVVQYGQARIAYSISNVGINLHVTRTGVDDSLDNVERLQFSDGKFAFDDHAAQAVKVLGTLFNEGAHTDASHASICLGYLDAGVSYADLMQGAINVALGASHTHADFVNLIYTDLAGFAPSPENLAYLVSLLDNHTYTETSMALVAADSDIEAARVDLTGQMQHGVAYA